MKTLNLLLVDDDEDDLELMEEVLDEIKNFKFKLTKCTSFKEAQKLLESTNYDLHIVDYLLGAYSGLELSRVIKNKDDISPIILLTGKGDSKVDHEASEIGISDYLVKSQINAIELERSIRYAMKHAEMFAAVKESEAKYKSVLEQSQDILFIATLDCQIISISDSLTKITQFTPEDLLEEGILGLLNNPEQIKNIKERVLKQEYIRNMQVSIRCKSGEEKIAQISCSHQKSYNNEDFIHGVLVDKTDEIRAQQTRIVFEKLESSARFMRTLAHEVRNPLSNITLGVEGMESELTEESPYLAIIKRNAYRIDDIITKVLNSAHIEFKQMAKTDLKKVLENVIINIQDKAALKSITLEISLPKVPIYINLNDEQISLAFTNILVNAIEAIDHKEGLIKVYFEGKSLFFKDNGPGISKDDQSMIFEPYFTRKSNGVGLGLASSLSIFKAHQMELQLHSDLGKGATFEVKLPESTEMG